ncbi:glycosyltransferase family 32 protein [Limosilactobacillus fermentum]|uniref:glycosyltransferase family 32 protein n=1 Tax=Limosilactobacillus fermentum TaxID=1613 RepID=UPI001E2C5EBB|nr:glycosyltransferase [Limosilactobacillus fermentum]
MTFSKMIPKKIHYIWFGGSKPSSLLAAIDTWKKRAPEYSIVEWNEKNLPYFKNDFYREALKNNDYAFASDYARLKVLYRYGGIYMDTDMYLLADPSTILKNKELVFGIHNSDVIFSAGFIAAVSKQEFIKKAVDVYNDLPYEMGHVKPNPLLLSPLAYKMYNFDHSAKTQVKNNGTVAAYSPNILLQPSFKSIAMHIGEKTWAAHSKHDQVRIIMREHIKNRFTAGTFRIVNDVLRKIV